VIRSWTAPDVQNFAAIGSRVSAPQIGDFAVPLGEQILLFFGFFNKAKTYTTKRICVKNMSKVVVQYNKVPFVGHDNYILYLDP